MMSDEPILCASGLSKSYGPVRVLDGVDLVLRRGEVHALVGENGAGKSTLSRIIAGLTPADAGTMCLHGGSYAPAGRRQAEDRGVRMVMQELNLIGTLTIAENLFLDRLPHRWGWVDHTRLREQARAALARVGLEGLDPFLPVATLGVGRQQMVEIAAGLARRCDLLILDEPTAALTAPEVDRLFERLAELRRDGTSIIYISHRTEEIRRIADHVSVLRDGRLVATRPAAALAQDEIVRLMVGRALDTSNVRRFRPPGPVALRVEGLRRAGAVRGVSFEVRRGEIFGLAGLMGSGRTETVRALFAADRPDGGRVFLGGSDRPARIRNPRDAVRQGLALVTENRKEEGLLLPLTVGANITLGSLPVLARGRTWIRRTAEAAECTRWIRALGIRCRHAGQPVGELSGGNQQKVVIARWLARDGEVFVFDEPTRGVDAGARHEIHRLLDDLVARGKAVVVVSSDLGELEVLADRIAVLSGGRIAGTFARGEWTHDGIMAAALGGRTQEEGT